MSISIKRMRQNPKNIPTVMPRGIPVSKSNHLLEPGGADECSQRAKALLRCNSGTVQSSHGAAIPGSAAHECS